jgi:hypothetical protein
VKEITCLCGERIVFLDPEVRVKTCPNCGMSVYQERREGVDLILAERKRRRKLTRENVVMLLSIAAVLVVAGLATLVLSSRQRAFSRAADLARQGDIAAAARDYVTAADGYTRAMEIYDIWFAGKGVMDPVRASLERANAKKQSADQAAQVELADRGLLTLSLEELAHQAYNDTTENWQRVFERDYLDRTVVMRGRIEERSGDAYKASQLTLSYRVFSPSGGEVLVAFDPPFFERYKLKSGADCIIKARLAGMYLDRGAPGAEGRWVLVIDGTKSALVTDVTYLRGLEWRIDDEVEKLVSAQASLSPSF